MTADGFSIDLAYLMDGLQDLKVDRDPLAAAVPLVNDLGKYLSDHMRPDHLSRLRLLALSANPWIQVRNLHNPAKVAGDTPVERLPQLGDHRWWSSAFATLSLLGALDLRVVSYTCEHQGQVFVHLVPEPGTGSRSESSMGAMRGHTDALHFPFPDEFEQAKNIPPPAPDFVVLTGIRNPNNTNTLVARLTKLLEKISSRSQDWLRQPIFLFKRQGTFETAADKFIGGPVLKRHDRYGDFIRFSISGVGVDAEKFPEAEKALEELGSALLECREPICISPGDIVLVNNRTALHGREALQKQLYGGQARWLLRTYGYRQDTPGRFKDSSKPHLLSCER